MPNIMITQATLARITDYADVVGVSAEKAINKAINDWMDITGDSKMICLFHRQDAKRATSRRLPRSSPHTLLSSHQQ